MKIVTVVGARPQFIKLALLSRQLRKRHKEIVIHTGQHYDYNMSDIFFRELKIARPDFNLNIVSGRQGKQVGRMLEGIEKILSEVKPDLVIVYGDTNSTLAGALAGAKLNIPVAHIEAGLRSFNRNMPEEINRIISDHLSALLFCPTKTAVENLRKEGISQGVFKVGDIMQESLFYFLGLAKKKSKILKKLRIKPKCYYLATIHRPENTDNKHRLLKIFSLLSEINLPVILPLHPRTKKMLSKLRIRYNKGKILIIKPVSYFDMLTLESNARIILTDSGGVQREAYFLRIPCVTLRGETEWLETVESGLNIVAGIDSKRVKDAMNKLLKIRPDWKDEKPPDVSRAVSCILGKYKIK